MKKGVNVFAALLLFLSCNSLKTSHSYPFTVTEASYYSWFANATERGTQVTIILSDVRNGVIFDSLVFRALKIPVIPETNYGNVIVKAVFPGNESVLENKAVSDSALNRLIYTWKGERSFYDIGKLTRLESKYLKRE